ncbi:hypothetical protein GCM10010123_42330 [Pilimelia anulata]|uniref:Uncharacterized protein n=1 Tax=Pilimelia anulata TaxID=53371 RepID=A0A8J3BEG6_9ACTN|nr:hypothetical protein [Pilimelia anulata]GGK07890.1 hypothetical protein GCM10010123_42330 [Pilimelia anulata]
MLFALGDPASFVGLLLGFLAALLLRASGLRLGRRLLGLPPGPRPALRTVVDPFGAVAAAVAGIGWGSCADLDVRGTRGRRVLAVAFGPLAPLLAGVLLMICYGLLFVDVPLGAGFTLQGFATGGGVLADVLFGVAFELICFALLDLLPLPPLDGFSLLWVAMRRPGPNAARIRHTLVDNNVGPVILMFLCFFPLRGPYLLLPFEFLGGVLTAVLLVLT